MMESIAMGRPSCRVVNPWRCIRCYGIGTHKGGMVVARPDQHVGYIGPRDEGLDGLKRYFDGIFLL